MLRIGLLLCDVHHDERPVPLRFQQLFQHHPELTWTTFDTINGELPNTVEACDGYLITGSPHSPNDRATWIDALRDFVVQLHRARRKTVGVCFGHQMIAQALGGQVELAPTGWGAALKRVEIVRRTPWMIPPLPHVNLVALHRSQVTRLPAGAALLGRSDYCPIALFQIDNHMVGVQAHPEVDPDFGREIVISGRDVIQSAHYEEDVASFSGPCHRNEVADWLANFWAGRSSEG